MIPPIKVHFMNNYGDDIYIGVESLGDAKKLVEELRKLKFPTEVLQYAVIPDESSDFVPDH